MNDKLIITLVLHPQFGYMLQPVLASLLKEAGVYSFTEAARTDSVSYPELTEKEQQVIQLSERYTNKELMRLFSKEKTEVDFLRKTTQKEIELYIRPFIEKQQARIARLMREIGLPLFLREKVSVRDFRGTREVEVMREPSEMVFRFSRSDHFTYSVTVRNGSANIELFEQYFAVIASNPVVAVIGQQLHYFTDVDEKKLQPFVGKRIIEVPEKNVPAYIRSFVVQCVKNYNVESEGLNIIALQYNPVALLKLEPDLHQRPVLNLQFCYGENCFSAARPYKKEVTVMEERGELSIGWFYRDKEWEEAHIAMLKDAGLRHSGNGLFYPAATDSYTGVSVEPGRSKEGAVHTESSVDSSLGVIEWINRNGGLLKKFELHQCFGEQLYYTGEIGLQLTVGDHKDWFDIRCLACFGDVKIPFIRFREHILSGNREYFLPDGRIAVLPEEWFNRFGEMFRYGKVETDGIRLRRFHFRVKEWVQNQCFSEEAEGGVDVDAEPPEALQATLRPYQKKGFRWMLGMQQKGFGGCLADDMGLGKTLQTIALLLHTYVEKREEAATLIVMPTSLIHNWQSELRKFAPILNIYVHTGGSRLQGEPFKRRIKRCQLVLTTYGVVRQDVDLLRECDFLYLVLDESQYIKNPASQTFDCVKQLQSTYKLALTGTPVENSLSDLWSQMDFLNEGILGKHADFRARFNEMEVIHDEDARQRLLKIIAPFILRRTKEEVAPELPPLTEEVVYCEMDAEQAGLYHEEKNKIRNVLLGQFGETDRSYSAAALSSLMRLRLLANHPAISHPEYKGGAGKFDEIIEQAEIIFSGHHKVLIFSSFVKHLQLLADYFTERGWRFAWLTGTTIDRKGEIDRFNNDQEVKAFFISLKAGGTGLNLTAADYVFIIDPWWNPAAELQAVGRAHRIGQDKKVTLYRFIVKGTIEEKIEQLQQHKSTLTKALVRPQISVEQMRELLD